MDWESLFDFAWTSSIQRFTYFIILGISALWWFVNFEIYIVYLGPVNADQFRF